MKKRRIPIEYHGKFTKIEERARVGGGRTNEQMDKRTKVPCVLQDFVPFGAAAQKGKQEKKKEERKEGRNSESKRYA